MAQWNELLIKGSSWQEKVAAILAAFGGIGAFVVFAYLSQLH